jgi:thioredoxin-like negative regulator of GroEL
LSPRARVWVAVGAAALAAAGIAVGVTLATRTTVPKSHLAAPPLADDPTAPAVVVTDVRTALQAWPSGTVARLRDAAARHPGSGLVRLELGLALAADGDAAGARQAWHEAARVQPDSPSAVYAENALHPDMPRNNPPFVPSFARARTRTERLILQGVAFQGALRPVSAERAFGAAAREAPGDAEAQVAAAVGLYDKDRPELAFSRLGPLVRRFPHAQTVRFHLGLLLIFLRELPLARHELALARAEGPQTPLGKRAELLLRASRKT